MMSSQDFILLNLVTSKLWSLKRMKICLYGGSHVGGQASVLQPISLYYTVENI